MHSICIGDIHRFLIGREAKPIRSCDVFHYSPNVSRSRIEAVHLIWQLRAGADALLEAVLGIGEPDGSVRVDDDVVDAVEPSAVVVREDCFDGVGWVRGHPGEAAAFSQGTLFAEKYAVAVIDGSIGEVYARWEGLVAPLIVAVLEDFGDFDLLGPVVAVLVARYEDLVGFGDVDACFVKERDVFFLDDAFDSRRRPDYIQERISVDNEVAVDTNTPRGSEDLCLPRCNMMS